MMTALAPGLGFCVLRGAIIITIRLKCVSIVVSRANELRSVCRSISWMGVWIGGSNGGGFIAGVGLKNTVKGTQSLYYTLMRIYFSLHITLRHTYEGIRAEEVRVQGQQVMAPLEKVGVQFIAQGSFDRDEHIGCCKD